MIDKSSTRHRGENWNPRSGAEEWSDDAPERGTGKPAADPEVLAKPKRRQFSATYRLRILEEADQCRMPGEIGRLLRREGLYSSHLANWRKARREGALRGLSSKQRGAKPKHRNPLDSKVSARVGVLRGCRGPCCGLVYR